MSLPLLGAGPSGSGNADAVAPTVSSAAVAADGTTYTIVFSEAVTGFAAGANGFTVTPSGGAATLVYSSGNGTTTVVFTASRTIGQGETITRGYTPGVITDASGNPLGSFSGQAVTNSSTQTPATVSTRTIGSSGTQITVVFSAAVTGFSSGAEGFALTGLTGGATTLTYLSGNGTSTIVFTISRTVFQTETGGVLAYTAGDITTVSNALAVANFSAQAVTNSSTQNQVNVRNVSTGTGLVATNSVTLPTRVSGDTLVAAVGFDAGGSAPAANTGWTRRINVDNGLGSIWLGVYTRQSDGTDNSPFSGTASGNYAYTVLSISNPVTGYDVSAPNNGGADTSIVAPTVTTTGARDVLVSSYLRSLGTGNITPPGGQTATTQVASGGITLRCGYEILTSAGATGTRTATNGTSTFWASANAAVK